MSRLLVLTTFLVAIFCGSSSAVTLTSFAGAGFPYTDAELGIQGFSIEDFEDATLAPDLVVGFGNLNGMTSLFHSGNLANEPSLSWDGTGVLDISTGPSNFPNHIITWLEVPVGTRSLGLAISAAPSGTPDLVVYNGATLILGHENVGDLFGFQEGSGLRNLYLRIDAEAGDPDITRLRFDVFSFERVLLDRVAFSDGSPVPEPQSLGFFLLAILFFTPRKTR